VAEKKGQPAKIAMFGFPHQLEAPICAKSFYRSDSVQFKWSPHKQAVLIFVSTDMDTTGQSYYGETKLFMLSTDGAIEMAVPLPGDDTVVVVVVVVVVVCLCVCVCVSSFPVVVCCIHTRPLSMKRLYLRVVYPWHRSVHT
jgi:hypothetical protein